MRETGGRFSCLLWETGGRFSCLRTYNYTAANGTTFVNPTAIEHRTDGVLTDTWSLTWEQGRQLSSVTTGSTTVRYEYNENGQRVRHQHGNGSVREYYYNGTQLEYIKFFNGNGTLACTLRYIYNNGGQAEYILYSAASKASTPASYNLYYILRDNTGVIQKLIKVRSATSSSVSVTLSVAAEYKYDPYGKLLSVTNLNGDSIGTYNPLVYKDYIWDTDTKWYYCNSRYYDPETGRWINADAFVSTGQSITDTNMFMYCGNEPIRFTDRSGYLYAVDAPGGYFGGSPAVLAEGIACMLGFAGATMLAVDIYSDVEILRQEMFWVRDFTRSQEKVEEETETIDVSKDPDSPVVFPVDPNTFNPVGLVKVPRNGTKNGTLISWMNTLTNTEVFRWDENLNYSNGPHYHINDPIYQKVHFDPGDSVPEPYSTIYFPLG